MLYETALPPDNLFLADRLFFHFSHSGLDNAGKTTIVKRIMGEDVNTVSPTLGFIIKTIEHSGYILCHL